MIGFVRECKELLCEKNFKTKKHKVIMNALLSPM